MATIAWLIPTLIDGSGGHRTFLQHAAYLEEQGHRCRIYVEDQEGSSQELRKKIRTLFGFDFEEVFPGWDKVQPCDLVFATIWYSAKVVRDLPFACLKAYFVQDYEGMFNPMGDAYLFAENSYTYGLHPISIGRWLPNELMDRFGVGAHYFDFCADLKVYRRLPEISRDKSVCFIYQPEKPRRCPELGIEALGIVKHVMPDVKIFLFGSKSKGAVWFDHENLGLLPLDRCNQLYNRCSVGLCISSSNPSRIPFEMMAAGLPVVEIHRRNTLYDFPDAAMLLCEQTPESIAAGILSILQKPKRIESMSEAGLRFMAKKPIDHGLDQFGKVVKALLKGKAFETEAPMRLYNQEAFKAKQGSVPSSKVAVHHGPSLDAPGRLGFLPPIFRKPVRQMVQRIRRVLS
ncbi:MAG: glycosyltransferase family 1 protein [Gammaproteobacteria bacterium]|nr:glycosyltransferase family 1 protein [Gammaproteobacteria bacterium]